MVDAALREVVGHEGAQSSADSQPLVDGAQQQNATVTGAVRCVKSDVDRVQIGAGNAERPGADCHWLAFAEVQRLMCSNKMLA